MFNIETQLDLKCLHCGLLLKDSSKLSKDQQFCCAGCKTVYKIINQYGLGRYYNLMTREQIDENRARPNPGQTSFEHFDDPNFKEKYEAAVGPINRQVCLYLDGVHCAACVWLIEKLPEVVRGIELSRLDFSKALVTINYDQSKVSLSTIARVLDSWGYCPHPTSGNPEREARRKSDMQLLLRLGVAAFSSMNVMMLAVSLHQAIFTGIDQVYRQLFSWVSLILALPAVLYSAQPFYRAAFGALKARRLHIDLPISLSIIAAFIASCINTLFGREQIYFDSLTALIFLLLLGRWFQYKGVQRAADAADITFSFAPSVARKQMGTNFKEVFVGSIAQGDIIEVLPNQVIPVDGEIIEGSSYLDLTVITGESRPVKVSLKDKVFAGSTNLGQRIVLSAQAVGAETRIGGILKLVDNPELRRANIVEFTDRIGGYFVGVVLVLSGIVFSYWWSDGFWVALDNTLALLVVTCPCALGIGTPVALSIALSQAARRGILIKGSDIIERLTQIKKIYFDKTGTITEGKLEVVRFSAKSEERQNVLETIKALEINIEHPVARALYSYALKHSDGALQTTYGDIESTQGHGIAGIDQYRNHWKIGSKTWLGGQLSSEGLAACSELLTEKLSPVLVTKNNRLVGVIGVGDRVRADSKAVVNALSELGKEVSILSGDEIHIASRIGNELEIPNDRIFGQATPEDKVRIIKHSQTLLPTCMVGDGVNDAAAFKVAHVGIGMHGGAETCLKVADIFIARPGLLPVLEAFQGAARTLRLVRINLGISLAYNIVGAGFAAAGMINPLVAAIVMPVSSLSVVLSSVLFKSFRR